MNVAAARQLPPILRGTAALVAEGLSNGQIARRLHVPVGTVKGRLTRLFELLDAANRAQIALTYLRATGQLVDPAEVASLRDRLAVAEDAIDRIRLGKTPTDDDWTLARDELADTSDWPDGATVIATAAWARGQLLAKGESASPSQATDKTGDS